MNLYLNIIDMVGTFRPKITLTEKLIKYFNIKEKIAWKL